MSCSVQADIITTRRAGRADASDDVEAAAAGEVHVQQAHVGPVVPGQVLGPARRRTRGHHLVPVVGERDDHRLRQQDVVVADDDPHGAAPHEATARLGTPRRPMVATTPPSPRGRRSSEPSNDATSARVMESPSDDLGHHVAQPGTVVTHGHRDVAVRVDRDVDGDRPVVAGRAYGVVDEAGDGPGERDRSGGGRHLGGRAEDQPAAGRGAQRVDGHRGAGGHVDQVGVVAGRVDEHVVHEAGQPLGLVGDQVEPPLRVAAGGLGEHQDGRERLAHVVAEAADRVDVRAPGRRGVRVDEHGRFLPDRSVHPSYALQRRFGARRRTIVTTDHRPPDSGGSTASSICGIQVSGPRRRGEAGLRLSRHVPTVAAPDHGRTPDPEPNEATHATTPHPVRAAAPRRS